MNSYPILIYFLKIDVKIFMEKHYIESNLLLKYLEKDILLCCWTERKICRLSHKSGRFSKINGLQVLGKLFKGPTNFSNLSYYFTN